MLCGNLKKSLSHLLLICNAERWDSGDPMFTAPFIHVTSPKKWVNKSFKEQHTATVWAEKARAAEDDEEYPDQGVEHKTHKSFTYKWTQHQSLSTCWLFPNTSPDHIFKKISLFFWFLSTLKKSCVVFASLTCTGNRHQEHKQHNHTCPHYIHDSLITVFLCVWTGLSLSLVHSWLFFFVFFFWLPRSESPSPHSDLIRGSGWTLYLPMDWVAACVNLRASCTTFNTHGEPLWLTVVCSAVTQIMSQVTGQGAECALFSIFLEKMFTIYLKSEKLRHTM